MCPSVSAFVSSDGYLFSEPAAATSALIAPIHVVYPSSRKYCRARAHMAGSLHAAEARIAGCADPSAPLPLEPEVEFAVAELERSDYDDFYGQLRTFNEEPSKKQPNDVCEKVWELAFEDPGVAGACLGWICAGVKGRGFY